MSVARSLPRGSASGFGKAGQTGILRGDLPTSEPSLGTDAALRVRVLANPRRDNRRARFCLFSAVWSEAFPQGHADARRPDGGVGWDESSRSMHDTRPSAHPRGESTAWTLVFAAWLVASVSALGSLFFSEVMQLPPCALCWYQRVFMFPLALILPLGLFPFDRQVVRYALPLALLGWLLGVFQMLLVAGIVPETLEPCTQGVPCSETVIEWFGFLTIPLLSVLAFSVIIALLALARIRGSR